MTEAESIPRPDGSSTSEDGADAGWYPDPDDVTGRWLRHWTGHSWSGLRKPATRAERDTLEWPAHDPGSSSTSTDQGVAAGWYPESEHWSRYWGGSDWTDERRPLGHHGSEPSPSVGFAPPGSLGEWRIWRSLHEARVRRDDQALASFWAGVAGVASFILALLTQSQVFMWAALLCGIGALVTSRFVRDRARQTDDATLLYLARWGQTLGWVVVGIFVFIIVVWVIFLGVLLGAVN